MKEWVQKQKKKIKKWRRRYKGLKITKKVFSILVAIANIGITAWQFYDKHLKERLAERNKKTAS